MLTPTVEQRPNGGDGRSESHTLRGSTVETPFDSVNVVLFKADVSKGARCALHPRQSISGRGGDRDATLNFE